MGIDYPGDRAGWERATRDEFDAGRVKGFRVDNTGGLAPVQPICAVINLIATSETRGRPVELHKLCLFALRFLLLRFRAGAEEPGVTDVEIE